MIIDWFGLEGTFRVIQFQPPAVKGPFQLDQVAQTPSNLTLSTSRDGIIDKWVIPLSYVCNKVMILAVVKLKLQNHKKKNKISKKFNINLKFSGVVILTGTRSYKTMVIVFEAHCIFFAETSR